MNKTVSQLGVSLAVFSLLLSACAVPGQQTATTEPAAPVADAVTWQVGVMPPDVEFPITVSYPSTFKFDCCGDNSSMIGGRIEHKDGAEKGEISFNSYVLKVCPPEKGTCPDGKGITKVSADDFFAQMKANEKANSVQSKNLYVESVPELSQFKDAFGYKWSEINDEAYYINTGDAVISIIINNRKTIGSEVVDTFLKSLKVAPKPVAWVDATFPKDYWHSYEVQVPADMTFTTGGDTDSFSASFLTKGDEQKVVVSDQVLMGCKGDPADCSIDTAVKMTAAEIYENTLKGYRSDETKKELPAFGTITNKNIDFVGFETTRDGMQGYEYVVKTSKGVLIVTFFETEKLGMNFILKTLNSIRPSTLNK